MGPLASTLLCYYEPEKVYATLVHLHDEYGMHGIFSPGFPGLLETIYVQERMIERMMPGVYTAFVGRYFSFTIERMTRIDDLFLPIEKAYGLDYKLCYEMVHYIVCK